LTSEQRDPWSEPVFEETPEQPNGPEVAGTSFPLLSTVLAGFAITIAVQLILHPALEEPSSRVLVALVAFLLGTLMFISSIGFALNAQANNYLPFLDMGLTGLRTLNVQDRSSWLSRIVQRWAVYFAAALFSFYVGVALLLAGLNIIVWEFVGGWIALILLVAIILNLAVVVYIQRNIDEMSQDAQAFERTGSVHRSKTTPSSGGDDDTSDQSTEERSS
jgi:hypothetical protein